jgi:hypothetical protein
LLFSAVNVKDVRVLDLELGPDVLATNVTVSRW